MLGEVVACGELVESAGSVVWSVLVDADGVAADVEVLVVEVAVTGEDVALLPSVGERLGANLLVEAEVLFDLVDAHFELQAPVEVGLYVVLDDVEVAGVVVQNLGVVVEMRVDVIEAFAKNGHHVSEHGNDLIELLAVGDFHIM